ncbi:MAG: amidohydrolase family protein, partial [Dorea sp.]
MIIDFHTHMFPDKIAKGTIDYLAEICQTQPCTDGTYAGLKKETDESGVDISVALPIVTNPKQFDSINRFASNYQTGKVLSFGSIHPDSDDYKGQLLKIKELGFKGIKLHPDYQEVYFNDIRYKRIVSYASELDLIVVVHAGQDPKSPEDIHCTPQMSAELIREV